MCVRECFECVLGSAESVLRGCVREYDQRHILSYHGIIKLCSCHVMVM